MGVGGSRSGNVPSTPLKICSSENSESRVNISPPHPPLCASVCLSVCLSVSLSLSLSASVCLSLFEACDSCLRRGSFFPGSSHTSDIKLATSMAWGYRVSAGTGPPGVSLL